ncbi:NAD(P)-binding protein [Marasmius fiardii PR-910]|nr:NAD(P)-binding protein [Marasmius fiardii PR-910]
MSDPDLSSTSLFNVKGKIVLVTGGGSGIGKMIAAGFVQNGAKVYIASRKESQLKEAVAEIERRAAANGSAHYLVGDVSSKAGCDALIIEFKKHESKLHVLVNNSGASWGSPYENVPEDRGWDYVFNLNVKSIFYMTVGLTDLLQKDSTSFDPARVINITSTASILANTEGSVSDTGNGIYSYNPSKAAANHLTSTLARKLGPRQITVNAILPGTFPSKMTAFGLRTYGEEAFTRQQPSGRIGTPQDMAGLALFLSSPASAHITGTHIILDGGSRFGAQKIAAATKL